MQMDQVKPNIFE